MTILKNQRGQGLTEYLVLLMLMAVASISLIGSLGSTIRAKITEAQRHIDKISADVASEVKGAGGALGGGTN